LVGLDARGAGDGALGLGGGRGVVAGAYHALAGRQVFLQVGREVWRVMMLRSAVS
jgi:hypothetical protein